MQVYALEDPCDPCYNNPYVKGDMSEVQKGARAAKPLAKGDVAGIYQGRLITRVRNEEMREGKKYRWKDKEERRKLNMARWYVGGESSRQLPGPPDY